MIHSIENNSDSQQHLDENLDKFKGDSLIVMKLLYSGLRLNAEMLVRDYGVHDRRLRDCYAARPDLVKKAWKLNDKGKRMYVEYFITIPPSPTKKAAIEMGERILEAMKNKGEQAKLF